MIEPIDNLADNIVGMRAIGVFTTEDYSSVIAPALAELAALHEKLRLLLHLGPEFTGFGTGAWSELTGEIRHTRFHKGAVVTDEGQIRTGLNMLKWTLHGDVRTFQNDEYAKALHWVAR